MWQVVLFAKNVPVSKQPARLDACKDCDKSVRGGKLICLAFFNGKWKGA